MTKNVFIIKKKDLFYSLMILNILYLLVLGRVRLCLAQGQFDKHNHSPYDVKKSQFKNSLEFSVYLFY